MFPKVSFVAVNPRESDITGYNQLIVYELLPVSKI